MKQNTPSTKTPSTYRANGTLATIHNFLDRVDEVQGSISQNPNLYPVYRKSDQTHKCILNKRITLFYQVVNPTQIDFITFWNSHKNPRNIKV